MKALSMWQPWASAVALGSKRIETRAWATKYRGPLAIHAAKRRVIGELIHYGCCRYWEGALYSVSHGSDGKQYLDEALPFGAVVAVCELVACRPTGSFTQDELDEVRRPLGRTDELYAWTERQMGDFRLGRYGWILENIRMVDPPVLFRGRQGLFNVPDDLIKEV